MHTLDSRSLNLGNCFGQKFPVAGEVRYFVSPGELVPSASTRTEGGFLIKVLPARAGAAPQQHDVAVVLDGGSLSVTPSELEIHAGDGVLWHTASPQMPGFQVVGRGHDFHFSSARIQNDAVYTHAFGVPGCYEWHDPHGSGASGTVNVKSFEAKTSEDRDRWFEMLKTPATVEIKGKTSKPSSVEIVVGQTVFWSVAESPGIAITDKRLLHMHTPRKSV